MKQNLKKYKYLGWSEKLDVDERDFVNKFLFSKGELDQIDIELALLNFSTYLKKHHGKDIIVLMDEYDSPINNAFMNFKNEEE